MIPNTKVTTLKVKLAVVVSSCLLDFMRDLHAETWKGFLLASLLFLLSCLQSLLHHHYMFHCFTVGMRLKTAIMGLVYRKVNLCPPLTVVALRTQGGLLAAFSFGHSYQFLEFSCMEWMCSPLCFPLGPLTSVSHKLAYIDQQRQGFSLD